MVDTGRAHAVLVEVLTGRPAMFQTASAEAQALEGQIHGVWDMLRRRPREHRNAWPLVSRLDDIAAELADRMLAFDEWQVIYRQILQLDRALQGKEQLMERSMTDANPKPVSLSAPATVLPTADAETQVLSNRELLQRLLRTGSRLVSKQIELARAELHADLAAELSTVRLLAAGAVGGILGLGLLLVAAVFGLAYWMPGWLAALGLGVTVLTASAAVGLVGWRRRVSAPLAVTRKTMSEDLKWAKERVA